MVIIKLNETDRLKIFDKKQISELNKFIEQINNAEFNIGTINAEESDLFCYAQKYETHDFNCEGWEQHRKFYDVQYIRAGQEKIYIHPSNEEAVYKVYDEKSDCQLIRADGRDCINVSAPCLVIFEPGEYHNAGNMYDNLKSEEVIKYVIKMEALIRGEN